ncbi:MAG: TauD/TfdA family dioxygenase [Paracoccus sp. BP8]|uniref:TauD/TfdA dioxygenase family protein n=1 Tax=Paracoccus pantotrophus TaxID=82367 RepID=UPI00048AC43A|nr:TauD/TfdA family dioxygenase [Paracoccus pantotrophus]RQP05402.1 MAG: TauD/TfdA family dioxygenase [Paracoccus sp. BP8]
MQNTTIEPGNTAGARPGSPTRTPVTEFIGVEYSGFDVTDDTQVDRHFEQIKQDLRDRKVIVFRGQSLDEESLERFSRRFGELARSVTETAAGKIDSPVVQHITNLDAEGKPSKTPFVNSNYFWHSDRLFFRNGLGMVLLYGKELPPSGGDTQFADMEAAYDGLSENDRALADSLRIVHSFEYMRLTYMKRPLTEKERAVAPPPMEHPLVRKNPDTGRKGLLLGMYASEVVGMPLEEGRALIARMQEHATSDRFVYTHVWRPGDFVIWNNLSTMHRAIANYDMEGHRRIMIRCAVEARDAIH